jgi:UDP-glucose 4-epimerase
VSVALITGGAGFIGSHVSSKFADVGFDVIVIDNLSSGKREQVDARATFHELDVRSDAAADVVARVRPDVLVHLAGQMDVRKSVADPVFDAGVNILGTLNLVEAVRREGLSSRVVFSSTGGVLYGDFVTPPNVETFPKDPESPYAISKLAVEHYLAYYGHVHGLDAVALRFGNVYGPRQDPHGEAGVVAIFCGRLLRNEPLTVFGDGCQTRDYVYVGDVVDAVMAASTRQLPGCGRLDERAFNIGTGVGTSVLDIAAVLQRVSGRSVAVMHAPPRPGEQQHSFVDVTKAGALLDWKPRVTLAEGLSSTYHWFAERPPSPLRTT